MLMCCPDWQIFLSTPSGWRATSAIAKGRCSRSISIHALRVEGDAVTMLYALADQIFLSTPSGWRATRAAHIGLLSNQFLSTPSGWRATSSGFYYLI